MTTIIKSLKASRFTILGLESRNSGELKAKKPPYRSVPESLKATPWDSTTP
jgi:hypothetical protein